MKRLVVSKHMTIILSDDCLMTAWLLSNECLLTAWWLSDDCLMTVCWWLPDGVPPDERLKTASWPSDDCLTMISTKTSKAVYFWNWTVWWIFCYCSVHPSSVLELLRTLLSFSKSNVYFRPGFFFSWAVKHEHMFVGKREREKKPRKSMSKCLALVKKCITLLLPEYFLILIRFGSEIKCVGGPHQVLWRKLWSKCLK